MTIIYIILALFVGWAIGATLECQCWINSEKNRRMIKRHHAAYAVTHLRDMKPAD